MLAKVLTIALLAAAPAMAQGTGSSAAAAGAATNSAAGNEASPAAQSGTRPAHNRHLNRPKTPSGGATNTAPPSPTRP